MAFVNERISEEDRKHYGLDEMWEKYKEDKSIRILGTPYEWTVNKESNSKLIHFARVIAEEYDHGYAYTREHWFLFYFQGEFFEVRLIMADSKKAFSEDGLHVTAYSVVWDLLSISPISKDEHNLKERLKEALEEYGENGTFSDNIKSHTTVVCNF